MPELPEVETIKRSLCDKILGKRIINIDVFTKRIITPLDRSSFEEKILYSTIDGVDRRGKYLLISLSSGYTLIISLRMTGQLLFCSDTRECTDSHTHLVFEFQDKTKLVFKDIRKFSTVHVIETTDLENAPDLIRLGVEPLGSDFTEQKLEELLSTRRKRIKQLLMDQTFIAGIGNIYADEILFRAGLNPERRADDLSKEEIHCLYLSIIAVLVEAVCQRGTSVRDYVDCNGTAGNYQKLLQVYGRKEEKCSHCGTRLVSKKLGGRTAHFCPRCQK